MATFYKNDGNFQADANIPLSSKETYLYKQPVVFDLHSMPKKYGRVGRLPHELCNRIKAFGRSLKELK